MEPDGRPYPTRSHAQRRADALEREATRFAAHLFALALLERNRAGRLPRLLSAAARADRRAERRLRASLAP